MARTKGSEGTTRKRVLELRRAGLSGVEIAKVVGVTHQAVYKHLKLLRESGALR